VQVVPALLDSDAAKAAIARARDTESAAVFNHSLRSYLFAQMLANHENLFPGTDYDQEAVFFGCVLHDLGAGSAAAGTVRFEVEGADLAATFLTDQGYSAATVDSVWEAIALHTSAGIAERRGTICYLVRGGVGMDFGRHTEFVEDTSAALIHDRFPRLHMERALVEAVIAHAGNSPDAAPRFSMPGDLLREYRTDGTTSMERDAFTSRWGP
jgi:hypothetical protein